MNVRFFVFVLFVVVVCCLFASLFFFSFLFLNFCCCCLFVCLYLCVCKYIYVKKKKKKKNIFFIRMCRPHSTFSITNKKKSKLFSPSQKFCQTIQINQFVISVLVIVTRAVGTEAPDTARQRRWPFAQYMDLAWRR